MYDESRHVQVLASTPLAAGETEKVAWRPEFSDRTFYAVPPGKKLSSATRRPG